MNNCYILCYIPLLKNNSSEDQRRRKLIEDRYSIFFIESNNGIEYVSEMNSKALHSIITSSPDLRLFWINSIFDYSDSPTKIAELIITCLKRDIVFHSEKEELYFDNIDKIEDIYPKVFEIFKRSLKKEYIPF